ncbi:hypothetical protein [Streptomyces sp. NBC_00690]|uniref:hypothetical protein n=1 Tax=Streptomyces sp. NBC_00690 TaxID=2975808 RepID=UPI002E2849B9|nr:hypothetical protein [Streptomyces sp. NBC_00690]
MMDSARIRLGSDVAWLELEHTGGDNWQLSADWCSRLRADFDAHLTVEEVLDFATRMLAQLRAPSGRRFSTAMTPGRNNPMTLTAESVGSGFAFLVCLTPNGDDEVCQLRMELGPIPVTELRRRFDALHSALTP